MGVVSARVCAKRISRVAWVVLCTGAHACTVVNDVDVCARSGEESEVNARSEGDQLLGGQGALAALPGGGAIAVFEAPVSALFPGQSEIRGALLDRRGHRLPTCGEESEATYAGPRLGEPSQSARGAARVFVSSSPEGKGALLYGETVEDQPFRIQLLPLLANGCSQLNPPFVVAESFDDEAPLRDAQLVPLGEDELGIVWGTGRPELPRVEVAVVEIGNEPSFLRIVDPLTNEALPEGRPVDLLPAGTSPHVFAATAGSDGRIAIAMQAFVVGAVQTSLLVYDPRGGIVAPPLLLAEQDDAVTASHRVGVAFDGTRYLVTWFGAAATGVRLHAQLVSRDLVRIGGPFIVSDVQGGEDGPNAAIQPLAGGGFFVVWEERNVGSRADTDGSVLAAAALSGTAARRFTNPACGIHTFQLNRGARGDQRRPATVQLADGTLLVAWTDDGTNGTDPSGSAIRVVSFVPSDLFPLEEATQ